MIKTRKYIALSISEKYVDELEAENAELKAANKQLLGDLEIANLRLLAAWKESASRESKLVKLKDQIHDEIWWHLVDEEPPEE